MIRPLGLEFRFVEHGDGHEDSPLKRTLQFRVNYEDWEPSWNDVPVVSARQAAIDDAAED